MVKSIQSQLKIQGAETKLDAEMGQKIPFAEASYDQVPSILSNN